MRGQILIFVLAVLAICAADERINFVFHHGQQTTEYSTATLNQILRHPSFRHTTQTVLFHYGPNQNLGTPHVNNIIQSYRANGNFNFIVIQYFSMATISRDNAAGLADSLATAMTRLFDNGYNSGFMNFLGYSLGAQIMARASRLIQSRSNFRHVIGRITALDPTGLGPIHTITVGRMSSADAQFVESIHTDGSLHGDHESRGHVAFFVNGGQTQPMCTSAVPQTRANCNALFSQTIWAESVRANKRIFPSLQCETMARYTAGVCNSNKVAHMGRVTDANLRGSFFLRTNTVAPFSRNSALP